MIELSFGGPEELGFYPMGNKLIDIKSKVFEKKSSEAKLRYIYVAVLLNTIILITLMWWFSQVFI